MAIKCAILDLVSAPPILYQLSDMIAGATPTVSTVIPTGSKEYTVNLQNIYIYIKKNEQRTRQPNKKGTCTVHEKSCAQQRRQYNSVR